MRGLASMTTLMVLAGARLAAGDVMEFQGEDLNHTSSPCTEDAVRIPHPNADSAYNAFLTHLQGVFVEDFESYAANSQLASMQFGADTATLSPPLTVLNVPVDTFNGVFPISGDQTLLQGIGAQQDVFTIDFDSPQVAFGFYVTDIEVGGNLTLRFHLTDGVTTIDRPVDAGVFPYDCRTENITGSVAAYGVIDEANPFVRVEFIRSLETDDGFGFDEFVIGAADNIDPCPNDLDGSGDVGVTDLLALLAAWGDCTACPEDFDGDGAVGVTDLLQLLASWGPCAL